jgi:hypothetical protein
MNPNVEQFLRTLLTTYPKVYLVSHGNDCFSVLVRNASGIVNISHAVCRLLEVSSRKNGTVPALGGYGGFPKNLI